MSEDRAAQTASLASDLHHIGPWIDATEELAGVHIAPGDVAMSGPDTAWITSRTSGVLYQWNGFILEIPIPGRVAGYELSALAAVSSRVAWIAANPKDCSAVDSPTPFLARHDARLRDWTIYDLPRDLACSSLTSIWISPDETAGFAGGGHAPDLWQSLWLSWNGVGWTRANSPAGATITSMSLDEQGMGFVGFDLNGCFDLNCTANSAIMAFDSEVFTPFSTAAVQRVLDLDGPWAVGSGTEAVDQGPKLYRRNDTTWDYFDADATDVDFGFYSTVALRLSSDELWYAGVHLVDQTWVTILGRLKDGNSTILPTPSQVRGIDFWNSDQGITVGDGFLLRYGEASGNGSSQGGGHE